MSDSSVLEIIKSDKFRLFIVSVLVLFSEVMCIRWFAAEIPLFGTLPNLVLTCVFIGCSAGLATYNKPYSRPIVTMGISSLVILMLIFASHLNLEYLNLYTGAIPILVSMGFILFWVASLSMVFMNLGRLLGKEFDKHKPLEAYSVNLAGSMAGVALFGLVSWLLAPPAVWIIIVAVLAYLLVPKKYIPIVAVVLVACSAYTDRNSIYSPYGQIQIAQETNETAVMPPGRVEGEHLRSRLELDGEKIPDKPADFTLYCGGKYFNTGWTVKKIKGWQDVPEVYKDMGFSARKYHIRVNVPFMASTSCKNTLVLGAGPGNDVQAALNFGAEHVDAVDRDPIIVKTGYDIHPQLPYKDKRVNAYVEDARTFLRRTKTKYDLIIFAFLDPGGALKTNSFLRSDNFVYTKESIKSAIDHLSKDGVVVLSFASTASGHNSIITRRLYATITDALGYKPYALASNYLPACWFIFGPGVKTLPPDFMEAAIMKEFPQPGEYKEGTKVATDDWPFLYLDFSNVLGLILYFLVLIMSAIIPLTILRFDDVSKLPFRTAGAMFLLGAAFMLIETKSITKLSLLFGATWMVSSIVIFAIVGLAFIANLIILKFDTKKVLPIYFMLSISLLVDYFFVVPTSTDINPLLLSSLSAVIACLPILFGGLIFSTLIKDSKVAVALLSVNILGVALGAILENLCVAIGITNLSLVALAIYLLSGLSLLIPESLNLEAITSKFVKSKDD